MVISTEGERVAENSLEEREGFTQVSHDDEKFLDNKIFVKKDGAEKDEECFYC